MKHDCPKCGGIDSVEKCKETRDTYQCDRCMAPFNSSELKEAGAW